MIVTKFVLRHKQTKLFGSYKRRKNHASYVIPVDLSRARIFNRRKDAERALNTWDFAVWEIIEVHLKVPYWV